MNRARATVIADASRTKVIHVKSGKAYKFVLAAVIVALKFLVALRWYRYMTLSTPLEPITMADFSVNWTTQHQYTDNDTTTFNVGIIDTQ